MGKKKSTKKTTTKKRKPSKTVAKQKTSKAKKGKISKVEYARLVAVFVTVALIITTVNFLQEYFLTKEDWTWAFVFMFAGVAGLVFLIIKMEHMVDKFDSSVE